MRRNKRSYSYSSYRPSYGYNKKRVRWDRIIPVALGVIAVLVIVIVFNFSRIKLAIKGYSWGEQNQILELTSTNVNEILSHDKMDHITDWLEYSKRYAYYDEFEKYYNLHRDLETKKVTKVVTSLFDNEVPKLKKLGYSEKQIWNVLKVSGVSDLDFLIEKNYSYETIQPYMDIQGFKVTSMPDYIKVYESKKNYNYAVLSVSYPGIISSNKNNKTYTIKNTDDYTILVKKGFSLKEDYEPKDLVKPNVTISPDCEQAKQYKLRKKAAQALEKMAEDAKKQGLYIAVNSAYRSYDEQKSIYTTYVKRWGGLYAKDHVANPGQSEHQTGLGVDLTSQSVIDKKKLVFGDTEEYKWVCNNAYKYGYILRYADGTSGITGITQEPWHFRYVGKKVAKQIYQNNWTLEEYILNTGDLPEFE